MSKMLPTTDFEARLKLLREAIAFRTHNGATPLPLERLEAYVAAQLNGADVLQLYPDVAARLDGSVVEAEVYARLYDLMVADANGTLPIPASMPQPDLSFLQPKPTLSERLQEAVQQVGELIRIRFSAELIPMLQPRPAFSNVRSAENERYGETLFVLQADQLPDGTEPVTVTAYRDATAPERCLLEVIVEPLGREFPHFDGIAVSIMLDDATSTKITDSWGTATFENVAVVRLSELALQIDMAA